MWVTRRGLGTVPTMTNSAPEPTVHVVGHYTGDIHAICASRKAAEQYVEVCRDPGVYEVVEIRLLDVNGARQASAARLRNYLDGELGQGMDTEKATACWQRRTATEWEGWTPPQATLPTEIHGQDLVVSLRRDYHLQARWARYAAAGARWQGADGVHTVVLPSGRALAWFADTMIAAASGVELVHSSAVVCDRLGDPLGPTCTGGTEQTPADWIPAPPPTAEGQPRWWWPAAGWVAEDKDSENDSTDEDSQKAVVWLFAHCFARTSDSQWGFAFDGPTALVRAVVDGDRAEVVEVVELPEGQIMWGSAVIVNGNSDNPDNLVVYGTLDEGATKILYAASVPMSSPADPEQWRYWTGDRQDHHSTGYWSEQCWSPDPARAAPVLDGVANHVGVVHFPVGDSLRLAEETWSLVTHDTRTDPFSPDIVVYQAPRPTGPWAGPQLLYRTPESGSGMITYNARVQALSANRSSVLVTYDVNTADSTSLDELDIWEYRPRWVLVDHTDLLPHNHDSGSPSGS